MKRQENKMVSVFILCLKEKKKHTKEQEKLDVIFLI